MLLKPRSLDAGLLAIALLAVSFSAIFIRLCESSPGKIAWYRLLGAGFVFLLWEILTRKRLQICLYDLRIALLAGLFLALHFYLWISSLFLTTIHSSVVLLATQPLFALLIQLALGTAAVSGRNVVSLGGGLFGAFILARGDFLAAGSAGVGDLYAIASAAMAAAYLVTGSSRTGRLIPYLTVVYLSGGSLLLVTTLIGGAGFLPATSSDFLWFALLIAIPTLIGHTLLNRSTRVFPAYFVNLSILSEPVLTGLWAWLVFAEPLSAHTLLGGAVIIVSVAVEFVPKAPGAMRPPGSEAE
ncbi:MAG: DMT family transporter [Acidobacteria bacterium]|nr:DMT family transporter [Acidobacteriota bacterium]